MEILNKILDIVCLPWNAQREGLSSVLAIHSRDFKLVRLLGEGGFSYVYLVKDIKTGQEFALKKIRCQFGQASIDAALREVQAYQTFRGPTIIEIEDHTIVQEDDGTSTVYIVLPYLPHGNLQDVINRNVVENKSYAMHKILYTVRDVCLALSILHGCQQLERHVQLTTDHAESVEGDDSQVPLMLKNEYARSTDISKGVMQYAHLDLKPANIMVTANDRVVLMDLGSCREARRHISTRAEALSIQDEAAEHSTMPYRAPELFDCRTNSLITEKVDIWSLGCVIYALLYGHSPFETTQTASGSIALAVLNCQYSMPIATRGQAEERLQELIQQCLQLSADERPPTTAILIMVEDMLSKFSQNSSG